MQGCGALLNYHGEVAFSSPKVALAAKNKANCC